MKTIRETRTVSTHAGGFNASHREEFRIREVPDDYQLIPGQELAPAGAKPSDWQPAATWKEILDGNDS